MRRRRARFFSHLFRVIDILNLARIDECVTRSLQDLSKGINLFMFLLGTYLIMLKNWLTNRRMKFDSVDVHPVEKALVVFYRIEAVAVSPNGETVAGEKKVGSVNNWTLPLSLNDDQ